MFTTGRYWSDSSQYNLVMNHTREGMEVILHDGMNVVSAYKKEGYEEYCYNNVKAKEAALLVQNGVRGCNAKNGSPYTFPGGVMVQHEFKKAGVSYLIQLSNKEVCGCSISGNGTDIEALYSTDLTMPSNIPYIKLTTLKNESMSYEDDDVVVRSVEEIALEKEDITWLQNKKYFIVNDETQAEQLFSFLDNYNGVIAYDTETTGLRINCFGKINSDYSRTLQKWNEEHPDETIRVDKLVGIIYCVESDVSYYFPARNRKFKNLYEDVNNPIRIKTIENIKARYTVGDLKYATGDMADYVRNTPSEQFTPDIILMERNRDILEKKHIVTHGGSFEGKVGFLYDIDTNIKDDTMLLHQLMYKFRSTTSNRGESSKLKYLSKVDLGIDQWELSDFFPDFKEEQYGEVRAKKGAKKRKKENSKIDFSYMTYEGTKIYAPTDGDCTMGLFKKYKTDMVKNHSELIYIYNVEVIVQSAIAYMEFYGHRINEKKIDDAKNRTSASMILLESELRQSIGYCGDVELEKYNTLKKMLSGEESERNEGEGDSILEAINELREAIDKDEEHPLNLSSPAQVASLFYDKLGIPSDNGDRSVAKGKRKALLKEKNPDGTLKYPAVKLYDNYTKENTAMTKFFDNLRYFMYPGGYIFSHYGQIAAATGRMSCSKPNAQQYPKSITSIVEPRPGFVMLDADYSQIEYRVLVGMSNNTQLAKMFEDPDTDYHTLMASLMYDVPYASVTPEMRKDAKSFNFGIPYGMGIASLALLLKGDKSRSSQEEAKEKYDLYFKNQPMTKKFFDQVKEMALVRGYTKTLWNRYRYYSFTDKDGNISREKKGAALRQAGNATIQGSAADIFKISVARNFMYIRENKLFGKFLIVNMIHDEQLMEVDVTKLDMRRILRDVGINMQFKVNGLPPLLIGAGIGPSWGKAKGKMAEIHPNLLEELSREADNIPIYHPTGDDTLNNPEKVLEYFSKRLLDFRRKKVADYLTNPDNFGKPMHPAIGSLINLQFNYGRGDDCKSYMDGKYSAEEFLLLNTADFIQENGLNVKAEWFRTSNMESQADEEDDDDFDEDDETLASEDDKFTLLDESDKVYGASIQDMIDVFGTCVLENQRICGIDMRNVYYKKKDALVDYIAGKVCDANEPGALEVVYLLENNRLNHTGVYVKDVSASQLDEIYNGKNLKKRA